MSIETYEALSVSWNFIVFDEGRTAVKDGKKRPLQDVMKEIKGHSDGEI